MESFNKLERKVKKISNYAKGGFDTLSFSSLFSTKYGKKFAQQLTDLSAFIFTSTFLTFPAAKLQNAWLTLVRTGEIEKLRPIAEPKDGFDEFIEIMSRLSDMVDDSELDFSDFYGRKELRRLLALLTLSAFAYLDSYGLGSIQ